MIKQIRHSMIRSAPSAARSLAQKVYTELLKAINHGRCRPGDRVREGDVAEWLRVSRTPVREALRRLESEDVLVKGTQGLVVVEIGEDAVFDLYELRETLEASAAAMAAKRATAADRRVLARILKDEAERRENDTTGLAAINRKFHGALAQAAHNGFLLKTLNSLQDSFLRLRSTTLSMPGRPKLALEEHRAIVRAIERGDANAAGRAARKHIRESRRYRLQLNRLVAPARMQPSRQPFSSRMPDTDSRSRMAFQ